MKFIIPQSAGSIAGMDCRMRRKLAASLDYLFERTKQAIDFADIDIAFVASAIVAHRQKPAVFACYFELVLALKAGRDDEAIHLWRRIAGAVDETPVLEIAPLSERALGEDAPRFIRLLDAAEEAPIFAAPDLASWPAFEANVAAALAILEDIDNALFDEFHALAVQIMGAQPRDSSVGFGGVSSLALWGAVTLNVSTHRTPLEVLEALVHEGAHLLLFALASDGPLLRNPLSQRFASPLRSGPRPMDGVFHATFVCARLHFLYRRLCDRPAAVSTTDLRAAESRMAQLSASFADSAPLIAEHAILTPTGRSVLDSMTDYMSHV